MDHPYSPLRRLYLLLAVLAFVLLFSRAAEAQSAERLHRFVISDTPAAAQCNEAKETGWFWWDTDEDTDGGLFVCTGAGGWKAVGGGSGSGDITDVWTDSSGDVSALTAAAGDSLDCGSADSCSPAPRSATLPATCTEGFFYQDTDSTGSEVYACTAANTWTKFLAAVDIDTSAEIAAIVGDETGSNALVFAASPALTGDPTVGGVSVCLESGANCPGAATTLEYHPDNYPDIATHASQTDEFDGGALLSWNSVNLDSANVTYGLDGVSIDSGASDEMHVSYIAAPAASGDYLFFVKMSARLLTSATMGCGIGIVHEGTGATPTELTGIYVRASSGTAVSVESFDADSYELAGFTSIQALALATGDNTRAATQDIYLGILFLGSTTDAIQPLYSNDGRQFRGLLTDTAITDPAAIFMFSRDDEDCFFHFFRTFSADPTVSAGSQLYRIGR